MKRIIKNWLYGIQNKDIPSYVTLFVNNICQLRCDMCFYWDAMQEKTEQLSLEEIDKLSKSLPNLLQLSLTGGEPTLRKDLDKLVTIFCKNSNVAKCSISTNGMLTDRITKQVTKFVGDNPNTNFRISISIDGDEQLHDKIRGIKGSYSNAKNTMFELKKIKYDNLHLDVTTTICKYNYSTFFEYIKDIEMDFNPNLYMVNYTRGITKEKDANEVPSEAYSNILEYVKSRKRKDNNLLHLAIKTMDRTVLEEINRIVRDNEFKHYCTAGKKFITIYQDGNVAPCEILGTMNKLDNSYLGKLQNFDFDVSKLLKTYYANQLKKWIKDSKCFCTFECARTNDVIFNPSYLGINIKNLIKELVYV